MKKKLLLLSFVEGATVMAVEMCGARSMAPYFGTGLYVWTSVMAVTLMALAGGYFVGGKQSESSDRPAESLFRILFFASLCVVLMPLVSKYLFPLFTALPFIPALMGCTFFLLFLPVFFLGASSPFFIRIQVIAAADSGKASGTIYAVSTFGGILSTLLCGFYLIPQLGIQYTLLMFGILLMAFSALVLSRFKPGTWLLFMILIAVNGRSKVPASVLYKNDGIMGTLVVQDLQQEKRTIRYLSLNGVTQTEIDLRSGKSISAYQQVIDTLIPIASSARSGALGLGLGGGYTGNVLVKKGYHTDAVEADRRIADLASLYFGLNPRINVTIGDARTYLNACNKTYALVVIDVFKSEELPSHLFSLESFIRLKQLLSDSARVIINWHGYLQGDLGYGTQIVVRTLREAGFYTIPCSGPGTEDERNLLLVATVRPLPALPCRLDETVAEASELNTDDRPILESANAGAGLRWRMNYYRYYQQHHLFN